MVRLQSVFDPLLYFHPLPLVETWYPSGFALELSTDSPEISAAASELWSRYPQISAAPPVRIRIAVSAADAKIPPEPAMPRGQENLISMIHGPENFAVADLARGFSFGCFTRDVAQDHAYVGYHFLELIAWLLLAARHVTILHAACIALNGRALLLAGDSGAGKTCFAYACARRGWTFLSGDATQLIRGDVENATVTGRPFSIRFRADARELFPELAGYAAARGFSGKLDIEPPVDDLNIATAVTAQAAHTVFLDRSPRPVAARLRAISVQDAFNRLEPAIFYGDDLLRATQRAAILRFVVARPAFELAYSDFDSAERLLRTLVQ